MRIRPYELFQGYEYMQGNLLIGYRNIPYVMPKVVICPVFLPIVTRLERIRLPSSKFLSHPKILATFKLGKGH